VVVKEIGILAVIEMLVFIGVFVIGLIYAWTKGALRWVMNYPE
jgi:NADH:ubiquinone oxidoreductase subunit 3 (subunit A)